MILVVFIIAVSILLTLLLKGYFEKENLKSENKEAFYDLLLTSDEYKLKGNYQEAEKVLKEGLKYSKEGYYYLGILYEEMNDERKARENYELAYKFKIWGAATLIGRLEEKKGNFKEAEKWYKKAIKNDQRETIYALGLFYYNRNDMEKAKTYLKKAAKKKEGYAIYTLAKIYYREKNYEEIKKYQKQMLEETEIYDVTADMKENIEYMLGDNQDKKYFELIEESNKFIDKKDYQNAEKVLLEAAKIKKKDIIKLQKCIKEYQWIKLLKNLKLHMKKVM